MENKKNNKGLRKYRIKVAVEEEKFSTGREGKFCAAMLPLKWFIFFLYEILHALNFSLKFQIPLGFVFQFLNPIFAWYSRTPPST